MENYKKTYSIYGVPMAKKLLKLGFNIIDVKINEKSGAVQFFFEQTNEFMEYMNKYNELKRIETSNKK